jgi:hypothetical protein
MKKSTLVVVCILAAVAAVTAWVLLGSKPRLPDSRQKLEPQTKELSWDNLSEWPVVSDAADVQQLPASATAVRTDDIDDEGLAALAKRCDEIRWLVLSRDFVLSIRSPDRLTEAGLAALKDLKRLEKLQFFTTRMPYDELVPTLAALQGLKRLAIYCSGTLSEAGSKALEESLPQCKITCTRIDSPGSGAKPSPPDME